MRFLRCAIIDDGFWMLPLTPLEQRLYLYISSRCQTRWGISEGTLVMVLHANLKRVRRGLNTLADMHMIERWKMPRPKCTEYQVTLTTHAKWGMGSKRAPLMGSKRAHSTGPNEPHDGGQTDLPPTTTSYSTDSSYDTALLAMIIKSVRTWHFARRPMGDTGIIHSRHQRTLLEIIKTIIGQGNSSESQLMANLDAIRDYLSQSKDVMSDDGRDYRGKTLGQWLAHWPDQLHRAQSYLELQRQNVVRMPNPLP